VTTCYKVIATVTIVLTLLAGCGKADPTATPVPPTATTIVVAPTNTPVPPSPTPVPPTSTPTDIPIPTETTEPSVTALSLISQDSLYTFLEELTSIQPYSGWRNSATEGEAEALDYVANRLEDLIYVQSLGMELERQSFHVFLATEMWETRLYVTTQGQETEVPADASRGHRHDVIQALRFDSDGVLNDAERNPVEAAGQVVLIRSAREIDDLLESETQGKIVFLDSAVIGIDPASRHRGSEESAEIIARLINKNIAGLVLVTQFSTEPVGSQGKFVGDGIALEGVTTEGVIPTLYVRLEDLAQAGISNWEDLTQIESARLVWDTDVFSPGTSGNLVARIPGADSSQAVILGAHIDSANSPGAMDNGINSAVLLEVARILNEARTQPPVDLYLVWFGSEEVGIYGSQHFVNTHQELLDRTMAALLMDGIIVSTPGSILVLDGWSHSRFGNSQLAFPNYLAQMAALRDITIDEVEDYQSIGSDNGGFSGFVTQAGLAFGSEQGDYAHSPYDTLETAQGLGDLMERVATVALIAALETGQDEPELHVTPEPDLRALIVASHTEVAHMNPTMLIELDRALAWEGFDVDVIPYGQAVTPADLANSDLVVVLPVIDYPSPGGDLTVYDEAWGDKEIESLVTFVEQGGLLVLTNSANRVLFGWTFDANEDWQDVNLLSEYFGVVFGEGTLSSSSAQTQREHPLMEHQSILRLIANNGVPFTMQTGEALAEIGARPAVGLVDYGEAGGQVLVLADVGILGFAGLVPPERDNFSFLRNLARYARIR
jgi:hypothetical protein